MPPTLVLPAVRRLGLVLVVAAALVAVVTVRMIGPQAAPAAAVDAPVPAGWDPMNLDPTPLPAWGVVGFGNSQSSNQVQVYDFAQIGDRIFVAGAFTGVQENGFDPTSQVFPQAYLAAFDLDSGEWIPSFAPSLDAAAYALDVNPSGKLVVGGEFTTVNGVARGGLAVVEPGDGATVGGFQAEVTSWWNGGTPARVYEVEVDGPDLYVVGTFDHVELPSGAFRVWSATRLDAVTGALDANWLPKPHYGAWDVDVDHDRGKVLLSGAFADIDDQPDTQSFAAVSIVDGSVIPADFPFEINMPWVTSQLYQTGTAYAGGNYWVAGAQHAIQMLDADTHERLVYATTGLSCDPFYYPQGGCGIPSSIGGGDYQDLEVIGDWVFAGCHCFKAKANLDYWENVGEHYSSFDGQRTHTWYAPAYNAVTGETSDFVAGLSRRPEGTYAIFGDTNGCLYIGGDYNRTAEGLWLGGFGKMCEPLGAPGALSGSSASGKVALIWTASTSPLPVDFYKVYRDGVFIGDTTTPGFSDSAATPGATHTYEVVAVDAHGRKSDPATVAVTVSVTDDVPPSSPPALTGEVVGGDDIVVTWEPATDDQGVDDYLVHRDYQFLGVVDADGPLEWIADVDMADGTYRYDVRARDFGDNLSPPSTVLVTVGVLDTQDPSGPLGPDATTDATSVTLSWNPSVDNVGVVGYLIHENYQYLAYAPGGSTTTWTHEGLVAGETYKYQVRAKDAAGNTSIPSVRLDVIVGDGVSVPDNMPLAVTPAQSGPTSITVEWDRPTNPGGITGYLVHDNYSYVAYVPGVDNHVFEHTGLNAGSTHRYEIRSQGNGVTSLPTERVKITLQ